MSELVERLNAGTIRQAGKFHWVPDIDATDAIMQEAATELERLSQRVAELEQQLAQAHAVPPCDHSGSYLVRDGSMTGTVICGRCGYRREWNAY